MHPFSTSSIKRVFHYSANIGGKLINSARRMMLIIYEAEQYRASAWQPMGIRSPRKFCIRKSQRKTCVVSVIATVNSEVQFVWRTLPICCQAFSPRNTLVRWASCKKFAIDNRFNHTGPFVSALGGRYRVNEIYLRASGDNVKTSAIDRGSNWTTTEKNRSNRTNGQSEW